MYKGGCVANIELKKQTFTIAFDGKRAQIKFFGDFGIGITFDNQFQYFTFTAGQEYFA